jgi:hypothetical protein
MNVQAFVKRKRDTVRASGNERSDLKCRIIGMSWNKDTGHTQHEMNMQHRGKQSTHGTGTSWGTCKMTGMCSIHGTYRIQDI